jgi:hypothetical protein
MKTAEVKPLVVKLRFEDISKEMVPFIWGSSFEYPGRGVNKELLRPTTDRKPEFPMWGPRALYISNFHEMYKDDGRLYPDEVYTDLSGLTTHEILAFRDKISIESSVLYHPSYARKGA